MKSFSDKFITVRKYYKMNQYNFGKPLEIGKSMVCRMEKGTTFPSDAVIKLFFQAYSVNPDWFYNDNGPMIIGPNPTHPTNPKPQGAMSVTESKVQLLLEQARYVLASGPEKYAQALSHVIVGFLGAVEAEEERKECRTQLGELTERDAIESTAPRQRETNVI